MKILVFDNYDSFTYNLVHLVEKITHSKVDVYRNDQVTLVKSKGIRQNHSFSWPGHSGRSGIVIALNKSLCIQ